MAGIALERGVSTNQRKAVLVILHGTDGDIPSLHCMAALATGTHLPAMDIGMAVGAAGPGIGKDRLGMTAHARHILVPADQGITGAIMVKLGHRPYRFPADRGVAVLAGNIQISMRTARDLGIVRLCTGTGDNKYQNR